jgi:hypothetical protein
MIGANAILMRKFGAESAHYRAQTVACYHEAGHACVGRILGLPSADAYIAGGAGLAHVHTRGNRTTASVVVMMAGAEAEVLFADGVAGNDAVDRRRIERLAAQHGLSTKELSDVRRLTRVPLKQHRADVQCVAGAR